MRFNNHKKGLGPDHFYIPTIHFYLLLKIMMDSYKINSSVQYLQKCISTPHICVEYCEWVNAHLCACNRECTDLNTVDVFDCSLPTSQTRTKNVNWFWESAIRRFFNCYFLNNQVPTVFGSTASRLLVIYFLYSIEKSAFFL